METKENKRTFFRRPPVKRKENIMRKILKQGMALSLSLMLGTIGCLGISSQYSDTVAVKAAVDESGKKAIADEIDILDYESNTSATEFVVNDIAGMEKLAKLVNNGTEDFTGKIVKLTVDLKYDKTIENNHNVIGDLTHQFNGIFNGEFHTISGINICSELQYVGLFGYAGKNAKITKIILKDSNIVSQYHNDYRPGNTAGIVAATFASVSECVSGSDVEITSIPDAGGIVGRVEDADISQCINLSTIKGKANVGGIVGEYTYDNSGMVKRCINYGTVNAENGAKAGGICGYKGTVSECCNIGEVYCDTFLSGNGNGLQDSGGIVGSGYSIVNCYNTGQISGGGENKIGYHVGGIAGTACFRSGEDSTIKNSYSVGEVKGGYRGAITCVFRNDIWKLSPCYWLTGIAPIDVCEDGRFDGVTMTPLTQNTSSVFEYNQSKMQSHAFVDELNTNSNELGYGEVWTADTKNINNGYPILKNVPYTIDDLINSSESNSSENDPYLPDDDETLDTTPVSHFYEDYEYNTQATNSTIRIYANGGTVTVPGTTEKKNYKQCVLYTDILPSYIYTVGKNGVVKPSSGKVIVGITSSDQKPELVKGKIVDKDAAKIASASIRSGQITVTAKAQAGKVYLWAIDTGKAAAAACIPVTVKPAPTTTYLYAVPNTDTSFAFGTTKQYKSGKVSVGESIKVYLYPTYKQNGSVLKVPNVNYTASVAAKYADYFSVEQSGNNPYCFEIRAKSLKNNKSVTGAITFTCGLNGRKTVFQATAVNPVVSISTANGSGLTRNSDNSFSITASNTAKTSGTFELRPVCCSPAEATTDKLMIFAMGNEHGFDEAKLKEGKVQITAKRSTAQSKISLKAASDKKTITVTAAKGTKPVTAYFLVVYNTKNDNGKKGYTVISVTAE